MRPGQLTPENAGVTRMRRRSTLSFNEAGAINPGKRCPSSLRGLWTGGFNEAGAINPGKPGDRRVGVGFRGRASMRPGQLTPENCRTDCTTCAGWGQLQ